MQSLQRKVIGDLPIISVSQFPMDFGTNICVGDVGTSGHNAWRQFQIGVTEAKTTYVCSLEADTLYPPDYFAFLPPRDDAMYLAMPLWVLFNQEKYTKKFCPKPTSSEGAMVVGREFILRSLEQLFHGKPQWTSTDRGNPTNLSYLHRFGAHEDFTLEYPVVTIKTDQNMHRRTPHRQHRCTAELPYWGKAQDVLEILT